MMMMTMMIMMTITMRMTMMTMMMTMMMTITWWGTFPDTWVLRQQHDPAQMALQPCFGLVVAPPGSDCRQWGVRRREQRSALSTSSCLCQPWAFPRKQFHLSLPQCLFLPNRWCSVVVGQVWKETAVEIAGQVRTFERRQRTSSCFQAGRTRGEPGRRCLRCSTCSSGGSASHTPASVIHYGVGNN